MLKQFNSTHRRVRHILLVFGLSLAITFITNSPPARGQNKQENGLWIGTLRNGSEITNKDLSRILKEHERTVEENLKKGRRIEEIGSSLSIGTGLQKADLTNAEMSGANLMWASLDGANLSGADLRGADLSGTHLKEANLSGADMRKANLSKADLRHADLERANLFGADLNGANLTGANLFGANLAGANLYSARLNYVDLTATQLVRIDLNGTDSGVPYVHVVDLGLTDPSEGYLATARIYRASLSGADLSNANLSGVDMSGIDLTDANLSEAVLRGAKLRKAHLNRATLSGADLSKADLNGAYLFQTKLKDAILARANLASAVYQPEPDLLPHIPSIAQAESLSSLTFSHSPHGLVELRENFKKAGLRRQEREITYAIKRTETHHLLEEDSGVSTLIGLLHMIMFEMTCKYGMSPGRPLQLLMMFIPLFSIPYIIAIKKRGNDGIWMVWPSDRMRKDKGEDKPILLHLGWFQALKFGLYFSLLSAFHIGWRELNVGNWLARIHPDEYTLRATGKTRFISGLQSLISVYLLALSVLSYFGRPFEW